MRHTGPTTITLPLKTLISHAFLPNYYVYFIIIININLEALLFPDGITVRVARSVTRWEANL